MGGVWSQNYEISRHVINIANSVISTPQTGDRLRFAQIEIFLHNRDGANVLAFSRLNDKYWALIRIASLNHLPGMRKGNIDGPVSLYNQGIFSQLYEVLKSTNCQGFTAPDFRRFYYRTI